MKALGNGRGYHQVPTESGSTKHVSVPRIDPISYAKNTTSGKGQNRKSSAAAGMSGPGSEADLVAQKADIANRKSVIG
jgi:hypothetical protein